MESSKVSLIIFSLYFGLVSFLFSVLGITTLVEEKTCYGELHNLLITVTVFSMVEFACFLGALANILYVVLKNMSTAEWSDMKKAFIETFLGGYRDFINLLWVVLGIVFLAHGNCPGSVHRQIVVVIVVLCFLMLLLSIKIRRDHRKMSSTSSTTDVFPSEPPVLLQTM